MTMILTERQKFIIKELLSEEDFVPTKFLASKFGVSLRTIRYDLENIECFLKKNNSELLKSPKKGIMLLSKEKISGLIDDEVMSSNHVILSSETREKLLIIKILLSNDYITSEKLASELQVSKSTILTIIKDINKDLKSFNILIKGRPNYGYMFTGSERDIRNYIVKRINPFIIENDFMNIIREHISVEGEGNIENVINELQTLLNVKFSKDDIQVISLRIMFFILRNLQEKTVDRDLEKIKQYKSTNVYKQTELFYKTIVDKFEIKYHEEELVYLTRILVECNVFNTVLNDEEFASFEDEEKLMDVVAEMVELCYQHIHLNEGEVEILVSDLMSHLKGTLKRSRLNINVENIILEQIKATYGDIFCIAEEIGKIFEENYNVKLSEDELGFITMYICKGMENSRSSIMRNILVVCNTGRGAAKLLATRIKNNIPEINIVRVVSMLDLEEDTELNDIDLIISTIELSNVTKRVIVVSPIITSYELSSIREYLYLNDNSLINSKKKMSLEKDIVSILRSHMPKNETLDVMEDIINIFKGYSSKSVEYTEKFNVSFWEYTAMIFVEIGEMLTNIFKEDISQNEFKKILGIFVHITMAIPRWQNNDFVVEQNLRGYKEKYSEKYMIIGESLKKISKTYNIPIKETEIIPILRYLL